MTPVEAYVERVARYGEEAKREAGAMRLWSNLRLLVFLAAVGGTIWAVRASQPLLALGCIVGGIVVFVAAVVRHHRHTQAHERAVRLVEINLEGQRRCEGGWQEHAMPGDEYVNRDHAFSSDLDLFGKHSLFQWFNTARTAAGRRETARLLLEPAGEREIPVRQEALKELAPKLDWRQRVEADAMAMEARELGSFCQWVESPGSPFLSSRLAAVWLFLPLVTVLLWLWAWLGGLEIVSFLAVCAVALQILVANLISRAQAKSFNAWLKWENEAVAIRSLLANVESETFRAPLNAEIAGALHGESGTPACETFRQLEKVLGSMAIRHNPLVHFIFNSALLWDLRVGRAAEQWRARHGRHVRDWLARFAQLEALCSLSVIHFDNPDWVFPQINNGQTLRAVGVGHPLLTMKGRITNDFQMDHPGSVALITGSNMSGKSTFLRTVGVNVVLACAGAPVCAREFACGVMHLYTSMRIADDMSRGVSSFYAELLRIKRIVDAARQGPILFLVDEIFRGTNSVDRIAGAEEVLKVLSQTPSLGLVSTHDLELGKLAESQPEKFTNYHFSEHYTDAGIEFSYQIQPGPSTTTNARHLIRMVGIGA